MKERLVTWLVAACSSLFVAVAIYAPLGAMVWNRYQNPVFPYFNSFVHSSFQKASNFKDRRYSVESVQDWFNHFSGLLLGSRHLESGALLHRSPILALGFLVLCGLFIYDLIRRQYAFSLFIEVSAITSYAIWSSTLSIYRYAAPLEIAMASLLIVVAIERCGIRKFAPWLVAGACAIAIAFGGAGAPVQRSAFTSEFLHLNVETLRAANTGHVVFAAKPSAYVATYLPASTDIVRIGGNLDAVMSDRWWTVAADHIRSTHGPWRILIDLHTSADTETMLADHGLSATIDSCLPLGGSQFDLFELCALHLS
jgi:hypothetical protein